jgi:hypothetical protein
MKIGGTTRRFSARASWDMPAEPRFDAELRAIYRRYTWRRDELLPYIVAAAREAESGMRIVRPMPFLDRSDTNLRDRWDKYVLEPDLVVAPVWHVGRREREVYLPRGEWQSYWDPEESYSGPTTLTVATPLDVIPVFMWAGGRAPGFPSAPRPPRPLRGRTLRALSRHPSLLGSRQKCFGLQQLDASRRRAAGRAGARDVPRFFLRELSLV